MILKYKIIAKSKKTNVLPWVLVMAFFLYHLIFFVVVTIWSLHNKTNFFFICFLSSMSEVLGTNVYLSCYFFFEYTESLDALFSYFLGMMNTCFYLTSKYIHVHFNIVWPVMDACKTTTVNDFMVNYCNYWHWQHISKQIAYPITTNHAHNYTVRTIKKFIKRSR